jgi:CHAT domain-containing protein
MISTWTIDCNAYSLLVEEFMRQLGLVDVTKALTLEHPSLGLNTL